MKRKALGKGLRSLIPQAPPPSVMPQPAVRAETALLQLDIDKILPNRKQPRQNFDTKQLEELAGSLKKDGVLQPVVVRAAGDGEFELIAGERRWRAAQLAGLLKIPAVVREVSDDRLLEVALIENIQREELNPIEEAAAYQALIDELDLTQDEVARRVGKGRPTVANALRLLNLPKDLQQMITLGQLSAGHAKVLASLSNAELQRSLADRAIREGLSVRQLELLASRAARATPARAGSRVKVRDPNVVAAEEALQRSLGTKVRIVPGRKGGRLELHYFSDEELERLFQLLRGTRKT